MSLSTFLTKLWSFIQGLITSLEDDLKNVMLPVTIDVINAIKNIEDLDPNDIIGSIISKANGAEIEDKLRQYLPTVITSLTILESVENAPTIEAQIQIVLQKITLSPDPAKNALYHSMAAMLLTDLSEGRLTFPEAVQLVEYYYQNNK